jgi:hypothetical protein
VSAGVGCVSMTAIAIIFGTRRGIGLPQDPPASCVGASACQNRSLGADYLQP